MEETEANETKGERKSPLWGRQKEERNYIKHSFITLAKEEGLTFFSLSLRETKKKGNKQEKNDVIMSPKGKLSPSGKVIVLLLFLPSKRDEGKQNTKKNKGEGNILEEKEEIPPPFLFFQRKK